jgi:protein PsiE
MRRFFNQLRNKTMKDILRIIESLGLTVIAVATVFAGIQEISVMIRAANVTLADLLMLFIYLEVLAMVAIYLEYHSLPVRLPMYIAIVALARYLILDIKTMDEVRVLAVAAATLLIALAVLTLRYSQTKFPYTDNKVGRNPSD